jgi:hypothetical protein
MKNKTQLPKWFDGTVYEKGDTVTNPFSGETYELNNLELSMYDFVMGCAMMPSNIISDKIIKNWQDGLSWFRTHNSKAYMVLLD